MDSESVTSLPSLRPPTILVVHPREKRRKCTVQPLRGREGFVFWNYPRRGAQPLEGYVRLGLGGELLTPQAQASGLLILDGTWKLADRMEKSFSDIPLRSLDDRWQTAYPRSSKVSEDPSAGLATIEALYAAYVQLALPVDSLLDSYYWRDRFLELNEAVIACYRVPPPAQ